MSELRERWIGKSEAVRLPRHYPSWASGNDQPNFHVELDEGKTGLAGPLGNINDDRPFRGAKRWEGTSKSGLVCVIELVERDGDIKRCNERKEETKWSCCVIASHDGPHIPITDELEHETPEGKMYVITNMRRGNP